MSIVAFKLLRTALAAGALALTAGAAPAQDFHGFAPTGFSGEMLSAENSARRP